MNTTGCTDFTYMFDTCKSLTTIPQLDTSKGTDFSYMFKNCTSLTSIPQLDTSKGTNFGSMFYNCTADVDGLDFSSATGKSSI